MKPNKNRSVSVTLTPGQPIPVQQDLIAQEVKVSLSKSEEATIQRLKPSLQAEARQDLIDRKTADRIAYLNDPKTKARLDRDALNRAEFSMRFNPETGTLSVYGIGRKWPVALYKSEWVALLAQAEVIKAQVALMPEEK